MNQHSKNKPPQRQVFDVVRPGRTPASPTSRPVVPNKVQVKDPDVIFAKRESLPDAKKHITIAPPEGAETLTPQVPATPQYSGAPAAESAAAPATFPDVPQPALHHTKTEVAEDLGRALLDQSGLADPVSPPDLSHMQAPVISHHKKPGTKHVLSAVIAMLVILLLLFATLNILLDAEIINLPLPHTDLF